VDARDKKTTMMTPQKIQAVSRQTNARVSRAGDRESIGIDATPDMPAYPMSLPCSQYILTEGLSDHKQVMQTAALTLPG